MEAKVGNVKRNSRSPCKTGVFGKRSARVSDSAGKYLLVFRSKEKQITDPSKKEIRIPTCRQGLCPGRISSPRSPATDEPALRFLQGLMTRPAPNRWHVCNSAHRKSTCYHQSYDNLRKHEQIPTFNARYPYWIRGSEEHTLGCQSIVSNSIRALPPAKLMPIRVQAS